MNEEEKKAIEELSKKAVICNYEERDYPNMICFKKDMIIALNLIEKLQKENEELKKDYYNVINKIENKIDRFDYKFEKAKKQNKNDIADYYWDLIINFKKLLESE